MAKKNPFTGREQASEFDLLLKMEKEVDLYKFTKRPMDVIGNEG
jgi:hypothetical protein